jgi:hypothetical protein
MRRSSALAAAAGLSIGLLAGVTVSSAATPEDSACRKVASSANTATGVNSAEVLDYSACRFNKLDAAVKALGATTPAPSPSATPTPSPAPTVAKPTASDTPIASPAPTVTPTTSSPSPTVEPTSASPSPTAGFPTTTSTGVPAGTTLTAYTGPSTITTAGTVIDGKRITSCIVIKANNVTIKNSLLQTNGCFFNVLSDNGNTGLQLTDVEIDGVNNATGDSAINGGGFTCLRCDLHGTVDGIKAQSNVVVQDSWIHDLVIGNDSHNDGIQSLGTTSLKILHNRIVMADGATSAVILSTGSASDMRNVQISNNLLGGGAFTVYGGYESGRDTLSKVSNISVTDNSFTTAVFARSGAYGPLTSVDSPVVTARNTYYDGSKAGQPV